MKILSFAFRNIWRNISRTVVTIGAMAFAGALMVFYTALMEGALEMMIRNVVAFRVGEAQIHAKNYRSDPDLYKRINNPEEIIGKLEKEGLFAAGRLYGIGLGASGPNSGGVSIIGIDVERESKVTRMSENLLDGQWLDTNDPKGVIVGRKLAKTLSVSPGSEVVILSQAADGSIANDLYHVRGIMKAVGGMIDSGGVLMGDATFRELMVLPEGVHEIAISRDQIRQDLTLLKEQIDRVAGEYEALTWKELAPVMAKVLETFDASLIVMTLITYIAIVMVTLNAMLMSVFERIREFGVMKALGVTPLQIVRLVFTEAFIQGLIACALAALFGGALSFHYQTAGIDFSAMAGVSSTTVAGVAFSPVWYTQPTFYAFAMPLGILMLVVMLAVLYPGVKAALIQPVKAIQHL